MSFDKTKQHVLNRGNPPDSFLTELVEWARSEDDAVFAPNAVPVDIFTVIKSSLGSPVLAASDQPQFHWDSLLHRKAAMLETMRVHAGFESSWQWNEGVDKSNTTSQAHKTGEETGIFQVSFDSEWIGHNAMAPFAAQHGIDTPEKFIQAMKEDHKLALSYYARLARISIEWAGPLLRHGDNSVYPWLRRDSMAEFMQLLS